MNNQHFQTPDKPLVALVRCESYDPDELDAAIKRGLELVGGAQAFFSPGETLLIKPNVLIGDPPDKHTTTHHAVLSAVGRVFQGAGARLTYGDSPAFGPPITSMRTCGMAGAADALGIPLADFIHGETVPFPEGQLIKQFPIAKGVLAADGVIDLAKFKTHALTRLTGAVKNLFGCIPGLVKSEHHATVKDMYQFGRMLLDLATLVNPRLCITDAVIGMEGNGPRNGDPRKVGLLIFATNPTANDAVMTRLMNLDPLLVPTLIAAEERQPGALQNYTLVGDPIDDFIMQDWRVDRSPANGFLRKGVFEKFMYKYTSPRPVIDPEKCTSCGTCVKMCPVDPKALSFPPRQRGYPPVYNYDRCIRCFCCQETCPYEAITVKVPFLGRLLR
jgi:uncharacterized protein (DUF362 family)/NAD-dependent dihydropyrimidine dehydrogenase PreA subunit